MDTQLLLNHLYYLQIAPRGAAYYHCITLLQTIFNLDYSMKNKVYTNFSLKCVHIKLDKVCIKLWYIINKNTK